MIELVTPTGEVRRYSYDLANRLSGEALYAEAAREALVKIVNYSFNEEGQPLGSDAGSVTDDIQELSKTYSYTYYSAFGEVEVVTGTVQNNLRIPGHYFDQEAGRHHNFHRDYDPALGRYVQSDPIGLKEGANTYAYVENNPMAYVDPQGLVKLYGNWCGPNWTGGYSKPYNELDDSQRKVALQPVDTLDACCMAHDITYANCRENYPCDEDKRAACIKEVDRKLSSCASQTGGGSRLLCRLEK